MTSFRDPLIRDEVSGFIAHMPEVLRWSTGAEVLRRIHDDYVEQLGSQLGGVLRRLHAEDPRRADVLAHDLEGASDAALLRVLTAPEISFVLLHPHASEPAGVADRLHLGFVAEAARSGHAVAVDAPLWTALGDWHVLPGGRASGCAPIGGRVAVDLESSQVSSIDITGRRRGKTALTRDDRAPTLARFEAAQRAIAATSPHIAGFVGEFIKVLVLQHDPDDDVYGSGSCQEYIGRAVITNPHVAEIDEVQLAESMVHEAVHSALYMQIQSVPWGLIALVGEPEPIMASRWTGNPLPLSTYLHACFVWYALIHFWGMVLRRGAIATDKIMPRLARATVGFCGAPLLSGLEERFRRQVLPAVRDALDTMQASVVDAMRELSCQAERPG